MINTNQSSFRSLFLFMTLTLTLFLANVEQVNATVHTTCFNYFMKKDHCVNAAASNSLRCKNKPQDHAKPVKTFALKKDTPSKKLGKSTTKTVDPSQKPVQKPDESTTKPIDPTTKPVDSTKKPVAPIVKPGESRPPQLARRYDAPDKSFTIGGGDGICGHYDSEKELGVCLWSGAKQTNITAESAGWLNGEKKSNCGKQIYIQRTGQPKSVQYVKVLDGCFFNAVEPEPGCFEIGVTVALFKAFKPTEEEIKSQNLLGGLTWDFNNLDGKRSQEGPV